MYADGVGAGDVGPCAGMVSLAPNKPMQPLPRFQTVLLSQAAIRDKFPDVKEVTFVDA